MPYAPTTLGAPTGPLRGLYSKSWWVMVSPTTTDITIQDVRKGAGYHPAPTNMIIGGLVLLKSCGI